MLHQAGIGVLGPVFRAHDLSSDRLVAVKAIRLDILPEVTATLSAELRRLAATPVPHSSAVSAFDAGIEHGRPYLVAEFVAGESFDVALRHLAPASLDAAVPLLEQIAGALDAAWAAGLGHGALHPRDIFLVPATPSMRVTGFGIARALERVGLAAPVRRPYTAPERLDGRPWDVRADVYSLGAIAHELLAGRRPATAGEQDGALAEVPQPQRPQVRAVLGRALSADPAARYGSALELVRALGAIGAGERAERVAAAVPVTAPPMPGEPAVEPPLDQPAGDQLPEPMAAPVPDIDELPLVTPAAAATAPVYVPAVEVSAAPPAPAYPWAAIAAVALAGLTVGAVGGYLVGTRAAAPAAVTTAASPPSPADTEVAVRVDPPPPPADLPPPVRPDVRPASRPAATGGGRIVVRSVPAGALVTLDGRHAGETPMTLSDVPFGAHTVVVARPGYAPRTERVTLSARDAVRQLTVDLVPGIDTERARLGSIYVDSRPRGARVTIDGRPLGTTPLRVPELPAGAHRVQVEMDGFAPQSSMVTVRPGEQARVSVTLGRSDRR